MRMNANAFEIYYLRTVKAARALAHTKRQRERERVSEREREIRTHTAYTYQRHFAPTFRGCLRRIQIFLALQIEFYFDFFWAQRE